MQRLVAQESISHNRARSPRDPFAAEIIAEQAEEFRAELKKLDDLAFVFLHATNNDHVQAERMLDDFIALLFEDNALQLFRYRYVLARIREGL